MTIFAVVPLVQQYLTFYTAHDDFLPAADFTITWVLMIISGLFFTLGSAAFVRAFEEPPKKPLFWYNRHFQSDELLGAWLFLIGTAPSVPYALIFFTLAPSFTYAGLVFIALISVGGCVLFILACYPNDTKRDNYLLPLCMRMCGAYRFIVVHLANDWLAGTWFFLWANLIGCLGALGLLFEACAKKDQEQIFIAFSSAVEGFLFLIGSLYFVSGSYPHASAFYYAAGRGQITSHEHGAHDVEAGNDKHAKKGKKKSSKGKAVVNPLVASAAGAASPSRQKHATIHAEDGDRAIPIAELTKQIARSSSKNKLDSDQAVQNPLHSPNASPSPSAKHAAHSPSSPSKQDGSASPSASPQVAAPLSSTYIYLDADDDLDADEGEDSEEERERIVRSERRGSSSGVGGRRMSRSS